MLTLDNTTIRAEGSVTGLHAGVYSFDSVARAVTISPFVEFDYGENVTVTVTSGVYGLNGVPMAADYAFSFHTVPARSHRPP